LEKGKKEKSRIKKSFKKIFEFLWDHIGAFWGPIKALRRPL
jgi:hypothetical protein